MTLDDLERPKRSHTEKIVLWSPSKKMNEDRPILSAAKCKSMILISKNIRYRRIFVGVPRGEGVKEQWRCQRRPFLAN